MPGIPQGLLRAPVKKKRRGAISSRSYASRVPEQGDSEPPVPPEPPEDDDVPPFSETPEGEPPEGEPPTPPTPSTPPTPTPTLPAYRSGGVDIAGLTQAGLRTPPANQPIYNEPPGPGPSEREGFMDRLLGEDAATISERTRATATGLTEGGEAAGAELASQRAFERGQRALQSKTLSSRGINPALALRAQQQGMGQLAAERTGIDAERAADIQLRALDTSAKLESAQGTLDSKGLALFTDLVNKGEDKEIAKMKVDALLKSDQDNLDLQWEQLRRDDERARDIAFAEDEGAIGEGFDVRTTGDQRPRYPLTEEELQDYERRLEESGESTYLESVGEKASSYAEKAAAKAKEYASEARDAVSDWLGLSDDDDEEEGDSDPKDKSSSSPKLPEKLRGPSKEVLDARDDVLSIYGDSLDFFRLKEGRRMGQEGREDFAIGPKGENTYLGRPIHPGMFKGWIKEREHLKAKGYFPDDPKEDAAFKEVLETYRQPIPDEFKYGTDLEMMPGVKGRPVRESPIGDPHRLGLDDPSINKRGEVAWPKKIPEHYWRRRLKAIKDAKKYADMGDWDAYRAGEWLEDEWVDDLVPVYPPYPPYYPPVLDVQVQTMRDSEKPGYWEQSRAYDLDQSLPYAQRATLPPDPYGPPPELRAPPLSRMSGNVGNDSQIEQSKEMRGMNIERLIELLERAEERSGDVYRRFGPAGSSAKELQQSLPPELRASFPADEEGDAEEEELSSTERYLGKDETSNPLDDLRISEKPYELDEEKELFASETLPGDVPPQPQGEGGDENKVSKGINYLNKAYSYGQQVPGLMKKGERGRSVKNLAEMQLRQKGEQLATQALKDVGIPDVAAGPLGTAGISALSSVGDYMTATPAERAINQEELLKYKLGKGTAETLAAPIGGALLSPLGPAGTAVGQVMAPYAAGKAYDTLSGGPPKRKKAALLSEQASQIARGKRRRPNLDNMDSSMDYLSRINSGRWA